VPIPANPINPTGIPRGVARPDVYAVFTRIELEGLETCADCASNWWCSTGTWRCELRQVEDRLGYPVDPRRPHDLAIAYALKVEAEFRDDLGRDHVAELVAAGNDGRLSPDDRNTLLRIEYANRESELAAAAVEVATISGMLPSIPTEAGLYPGRERRWRSDLTEAEERERRRLEEARWEGVLGEEQALRYEALTEPQAAARVRWELVPTAVRDGAERLVRRRAAEARGEVPSTRRASRTIRMRIRTYAHRSFRDQLGAIASEEDPQTLEVLIRELRRQAKDLRLLPRGHDRRHGQ
jgi:hypothetical protein